MKRCACFLLLMSVMLCVSAFAETETSETVEVYRNTFDDATALADFTGYGGMWRVYGGRLYLTMGSGTTGTHSFLLYTGEERLTTLRDYVLDVDMYNTQTQAGVIARSDLSCIRTDTGNGFAGYFAFTSFDGKKAALGYATPDGGWGGNIKVSENIFSPLSDLHLQVVVKGNDIRYTVTDLHTGETLWEYAAEHSLWERGSFGFRMSAVTKDGLTNQYMTSFDNLVISAFSSSLSTSLSMTVDSRTAYVNDKQYVLDAAPILRDGRTMLPIRFVAERLGAEVGWEGESRTVTVKTAEKEIRISVGASEATVNGASVALDVPAFIENGRTYLPVRFVAEGLGATVGWDGATRTVTVQGQPPKAEPRQPRTEAEHSELYDPKYAVEVIIRYFEEVCLEDAAGNSNGKVKKWISPIFYKLYGDYTPEDVTAVEEFAAFLNSVEGFPGLYPATAGTPENMQIYYGTQEELIDRMGIRGAENAYNIKGMVRFHHHLKYLDLTYATICLRTDESQIERNGTMREEIINGIGFSNDSLTRSGSVIFEYGQKAEEMDAVDTLLFRLLYHPCIDPGMGHEEVDRVIRELYY